MENASNILNLIATLVTIVLPVGAILKRVGIAFLSHTTIEYSLKTKAEKYKERLFKVLVLFALVWILELIGYFILPDVLTAFGISDETINIVVLISVILVVILSFICFLYHEIMKSMKRKINDKVNNVLAFLLLVLGITASLNYNNSIAVMAVTLQLCVAAIITMVLACFLTTWPNIDRAVTYFHEDNGTVKYIYHGFKEDYCLIGDTEELGDSASIYKIEDLEKKTIYLNKRSDEKITANNSKYIKEIIETNEKEKELIDKLAESINDASGK